jgi:hypothetical protein
LSSSAPNKSHPVPTHLSYHDQSVATATAEEDKSENDDYYRIDDDTDNSNYDQI